MAMAGVFFVLCLVLVTSESAAAEPLTPAEFELYKRFEALCNAEPETPREVSERLGSPCLAKMARLNPSIPVVKQMRRAALHVFNTTGEIHLSEVRSTPSHISEQYKLHMCTIPKIASTELAALILRIESVPRNQLKTFFPTDKDRVNYMWPYSKGPFLRAKSTSEKLDILSDRSWLNVAFVRNPYTRVLSGWKQKILHPTDSIHHAIKCAYPGIHSRSSFRVLGIFASGESRRCFDVR